MKRMMCNVMMKNMHYQHEFENFMICCYMSTNVSSALEVTEGFGKNMITEF